MNTKKNKLKPNVSGAQNGSIILIATILMFSNFTFFACRAPEERIDYNKIEKVKIGYLPKGINPNLQISNCEDILDYKETFKDTIIIDKTLFRRLASCINKLEYSSKEVSYDFRIMCLIKIEGDTIPQKLCLGGGNLIVFNGNLMKDDSTLFNLIAKEVYD